MQTSKLPPCASRRTGAIISANCWYSDLKVVWLTERAALMSLAMQPRSLMSQLGGPLAMVVPSPTACEAWNIEAWMASTIAKHSIFLQQNQAHN